MVVSSVREPRADAEDVPVVKVVWEPEAPVPMTSGAVSLQHRDSPLDDVARRDASRDARESGGHSVGPIEITRVVKELDRDPRPRLNRQQGRGRVRKTPTPAQTKFRTCRGTMQESPRGPSAFTNGHAPRQRPVVVGVRLVRPAAIAGSDPRAITASTPTINALPAPRMGVVSAQGELRRHWPVNKPNTQQFDVRDLSLVHEDEPLDWSPRHLGRRLFLRRVGPRSPLRARPTMDRLLEAVWEIGGLMVYTAFPTFVIAAAGRRCGHADREGQPGALDRSARAMRADRSAPSR